MLPVMAAVLSSIKTIHRLSFIIKYNMVAGISCYELRSMYVKKYDKRVFYFFLKIENYTIFMDTRKTCHW